MSQQALRVALVLVTLVLALLARPRLALAHHVPGHGSSEGVRSINSLGNRGGSANTRILLLNEFSHSGSALVPGQRNDLSLLGEFAPLPAFSFGAQLPLTILAEQPPGLPASTQVGYGDTRVFMRVTPYADKLIHRVLTVAISASFPTRTVRASVDPGRVWSVTPSIIFTRTYSKLFWQVLALASTEWRPAGIALDLSAGAQVGGRLAKGRLAIGAGGLVDVRTVNGCTTPDDSLELCTDSRAGEEEREIGSTRATALGTLAWTFHPRWSLNLALMLPVTPKRDFDVGASLGVQVVF